MDWDADVKPIVTSVVRHGLTWASGFLVSAGWIQQDQTAQFIALTSGALLYGASQAWAIIQKRQQKIAVAEAAAQPGNPTP